MALDGEIADPRDPGSLPSGDGEPGGTATIKFTVRADPIPTVSEWGMVTMTLLVLTAGTVVFMRKRQAA